MAHWCEFCQMEHSSASCFHPGRPRIQDTFRVPDVFTPDDNPRVAYGYLAKAYRELEAQCAAMRQCLERWVGSSAFEYMPEPGTLVYDTDAALATDAGKALLDEVKRLREFVAKVQGVLASEDDVDPVCTILDILHSTLGR